MTAEDHTLADQLAAWKERMAKLEAEEADRAAQEAEAKRQEYLKRTGRTEMKP